MSLGDCMEVVLFIFCFFVSVEFKTNLEGVILSEDINKTQSKNLHTESFNLLSIEMYTYNYMII